VEDEDANGGDASGYAGGESGNAAYAVESGDGDEFGSSEVVAGGEENWGSGGGGNTSGW
jgi:hypothetical protein